MGAKVGPNTSLAQIGCKILIAIANSEHSKAEVKSTEEVLRHFEDYNKIENRQINKPKALFSMDIKSFYPSIDVHKAAAIARLMWERSPLSIQGVDYDELAKYLGSNLSPIEILNENISHLVYKKKSKKKNKLKKEMKEKLNKDRNTQKKSNKKHKSEKIEKTRWG